MTPADFSDLPAHIGLLLEMAGLVLALGGAAGALLNLYYGAPRKSWREQRDVMFWSALAMVVSIAIALWTFGHHRARVTVDWWPFEGEMLVSATLVFVFLAGIIVAWNLLRLNNPERQH